MLSRRPDVYWYGKKALNCLNVKRKRPKGDHQLFLYFRRNSRNSLVFCCVCGSYPYIYIIQVLFSLCSCITPLMFYLLWEPLFIYSIVQFILKILLLEIYYYWSFSLNRKSKKNAQNTVDSKFFLLLFEDYFYFLNFSFEYNIK